MTAQTLEFLISTRADMQGIRQSVAGMEDLKNKANTLFSNLKMGFLGGLGFSGVAGVQNLISDLNAAGNAGIQMQGQLEQAGLTVATLLGQFRGAEFGSFNARLAESGKILEQLRDKGLMAEATFGQLVDTMSGSAGAMYGAGIKSAEQQIDLIVAMSQALAVAGGEQEQLTAEISRMVSGQVNQYDRVAKAIGLTNTELRAAAATGGTFALIMERLRPITDDAAEGMGTLNSLITINQELWENAITEASGSAFATRKKQMEDLNSAMESEGFKRGLTALLEAGQKFQQWVLSSKVWLAEHGTLIANVAELLKGLALGYGIKKLWDWTKATALGTTAVQSHISALRQESVALAANSAGQTANAAARAANAASSAAAAAVPRSGVIAAAPVPVGGVASTVTGVSGAPAVSAHGNRVAEYARMRGMPHMEAAAEVRGMMDGERRNQAEAAARTASMQRATEALKKSSQAADGARASWVGLTTSLKGFGGMAANVGNALMGIASSMSLPAGVALGYLNQKSGVSPLHMLSGYANEDDLQAAAALSESDHKVLSEFLARAKNIASKEDLADLMTEVTDFRDRRAEGARGNVPMGTRKVITGSVSQAQDVMRRLAGRDDTDLPWRADKENSDRKAEADTAYKKLKQEQQQAVVDLRDRRKTDAAAKALEDAADRGDTKLLDDGRASAERKLANSRTDDEREKLQEQLTTYDALLQRAAEVTATRARHSQFLEKELAIGRAIEEGRARDAAIAAAQLQVEQQHGEALKNKEITQAQYNELLRQAETAAKRSADAREAGAEMQLLDAQGRKRIEQVSTVGRKEIEVLRERLAIEQEIADARYRREMDAGTRSGASSVELQTLRTNHETDTLARKNQLADAERAARAEDLDADPMRRRGLHRGSGPGEILRNADGTLGDGVTESRQGTLTGPSRLNRDKPTAFRPDDAGKTADRSTQQADAAITKSADKVAASIDRLGGTVAKKFAAMDVRITNAEKLIGAQRS